MFSYEREQKVCNIGGAVFGGQPGQHPPLLIGNIFQKGDSLLENRKEGKFDREGTEKRIRDVEKLSLSLGVPVLIAMVANSAEEMKNYVDFFVNVSDLPFAIDIWVEKTRLAAAHYVSERKLQSRCLYNSITPWDSDIASQVAELKDLGIKHVVLQAFDTADKLPGGRLKSLSKLLPIVEKGNFDSILVDTSAMNLPATIYSLEANYLIKKEYGLPVGFAPSNGSYMWRKTLTEEQRPWFPPVDAGVHAIASMASDFLLFGPLSGINRIFPAVAAANSMLGALRFEQTQILPESNSPFNLLFPDIVGQFKKEKGEVIQ